MVRHLLPHLSQHQPLPTLPHRPTVTAGLNESDWNFFLHEWGRYTRQTGIEDNVLRDELWSCLDSDLAHLAFSEGLERTTEAAFLQQIKELAVTVLHPSVHIVALHQMKQQDGETESILCQGKRNSIKL